MNKLFGLAQTSYKTYRNLYLYGAVALLVLVIFLVLMWVVAWGPERDRNAAANARVDAAIARATTGNARDAGRLTLDEMRAETAIDDQTRKSRDAILEAPGAHAPVDPAVRDAGVRAICLRQSAARDPACDKLH